MPSLFHQHRTFADAERARIARWFGEGLLEPVFHDPRHGPLPVRAHMRDTWLAEADRIIDRHVVQLRRMAGETIAIGMVLAIIYGVAAALLGDLVPLLRRVPAPFACAPAFVWPFLQEFRYRRAILSLQRAIGDRLCVRDRVDAKFVGAGRKYNLFKSLSVLLTLLVTGWCVASALRQDGVPDIVPLLLAYPAIWALYWAGRRVDRNQQRCLRTAD